MPYISQGGDIWHGKSKSGRGTVSNTTGEKSTPIRPHESALSRGSPAAGCGTGTPAEEGVLEDTIDAVDSEEPEEDEGREAAGRQRQGPGAMGTLRRKNMGLLGHLPSGMETKIKHGIWCKKMRLDCAQTECGMVDPRPNQKPNRNENVVKNT